MIEVEILKYVLTIVSEDGICPVNELVLAHDGFMLAIPPDGPGWLLYITRDSDGCTNDLATGGARGGGHSCVLWLDWHAF